MPLNFAFFGINRASQAINAFPEINHWAVGGHSLGGAMAAEFAKENAQKVDSLVLWASYPAENTDLSMLVIKAISIYATNDRLAGPEEVRSAQPRLPVRAQFIEITGGNHAGFGSYGNQNGDGERVIVKS
jgi:predicted alpha/beta-hydrolase family hydrolase